MNNDDINIKILKYLSGEISDSEIEEFNTWLSSSDENREYFEKIQKTWNSVKIPQPETIPDFETFWNELSSKMNDEEENVGRENVFNPAKRKKLIGYIFNPGFAISAAIVVFISVIVIFLFSGKKPPLSYYTLKAQTKNIVLPDSSSVVLNSESSIDYEVENNTRYVKLKGEALFEVKKNNTAFEVHTFNSIIRVKGTRFNVKARDKKTSLVVENGTVLFSSLKKPDKKVKVKKNQMSMCINKHSPTAPVPVEAEHLNGWINGILVYENIPLSELAEELTRHFNTKVIVSDISLLGLKITGTFDNQSLVDILNAVSKTVNCKYKRENNIIFLYK
jgi:ferric-dicitrate binding protein FerR (iron transport regulator)